jgi:hypothetical protein
VRDSGNWLVWTVFAVIVVAAAGLYSSAIETDGIERTMLDLLNSLLMLLQGSALGETVRNAEYLYPVLEATHILGIALLVGPAFAFDVRLLGAGQRVLSVTTAARYLLPVSHIGFIIAVTTGIALLSSQATTVAGTGAAPWKLGLLIVACLNVPVFHYGIYRRVNEWTDAAVTPVAARIAAAVSVIAWTGVIFAGRLLAYT